MTTYDVTLSGCRPDPLMSYLKALGVLRLVTEQKDPNAKGCWRNDMFMLRSTLDEQALIDFFTEEYQPTPVFAPWIGGAGFLEDGGQAYDALDGIKAASTERFVKMKNALKSIETVPSIKELKDNRKKLKLLEKKSDLKKEKKIPDNDKKILEEFLKERIKDFTWSAGLNEKEKEIQKELKRHDNKIKKEMLLEIRKNFPEQVIAWLDSCGVFLEDGFKTAPMLGSGGNDGRMEFSTNFIQNVLKLVKTPTAVRRWVPISLFKTEQGTLEAASIGQFAPGASGGPNASHGMEGVSIINPFDYILMIEGVLLIQSSAVKRLTNSQSIKAAFPFTVSTTNAGNNSLDGAEKSRGETWLPLWSSPAKLAEIFQLFKEGRAELEGRQSATGIDFIRAIATLGVDRGIESFIRYGYQERSGLAYLATNLGRFAVRSQGDADLLREIDSWLNGFRSVAAEKNAPPRLTRALRRIDSAIFDFCRYGGNFRFAEILCALGAAERELAIKQHSNPLGGLSTKWLDAANDGSIEFELALSVAGIGARDRKLGSIRANLESVEENGSDWKWAEKSRRAVWNSSSLCDNLIAVTQRRYMDAAREGSDEAPLQNERAVSLNAVAAFIAGDVDEKRIEELLLGLGLVNHAQKYPELKQEAESRDTQLLPAAYALMKLLFLPHLEINGETIAVKPEPAVISLLRAGRIGEACQTAARRLRVSGLTPMPHRLSGRPTRDNEWRDINDADARRIAAALIFPISQSDVKRLIKQVIRPETN